MQKKLTSRIDENLIEKAKFFSEKYGKYVSQIVSDYFSILLGKYSQSDSEITPIVRSLKEAFKESKIDKKDYKRYLEKKYL
ncbi:MAG: antitoxin [Candidatus Marinimicrobia bacterium]|nr:antitoxin [Candidatus Neomarinimicrobiota bacterium]